MPYDPAPRRRRSIRVPGYDYARPAAYFVTICTHDRACLLGEILDAQMHLNELGHLVEEEWSRTGSLRPNVALEAFVVMPNHVHGIVVIAPPGQIATADPHGYRVDPPTGSVGAQRAAPLPEPRRQGVDVGGRLNVGPGSLGAVVRAFKSAATRRINATRGTPGAKVWQRNYWERILRDEREWQACRRYIQQNPARWDKDPNNPQNQ